MASSTRRRVSSLTDGEPFRTRETVPTPTPASAATRAIVVPLTLSLPPWKRFQWKRFQSWQTCQPGASPAHGLASTLRRDGRRHDTRLVVAGRGALPDLPALVRGLRRRRDRRPARNPGAAGPPRVARDRRHLAQPDDAVAERRLGL